MVKLLAIGQARFVSIEIKSNHKRFSFFFVLQTANILIQKGQGRLV